jgi:hypothetical protein
MWAYAFLHFEGHAGAGARVFHAGEIEDMARTNAVSTSQPIDNIPVRIVRSRW